MINDDQIKFKMMTVGCPVNQAETEALKNSFKQKGIVEINEADHKGADIYVINSCAVTQAAARKSRKKAKKAKKENSNGVVALMGCYGEILPQEVKEKAPEIDLIIGTRGRNELVEKTLKIFAIKKSQGAGVQIKMSNDEDKARDAGNANEDFEELGINYEFKRQRPVVKIQEGCNQSCSFCIVTIARGKPKSRNPEKVIEEVKSLASKGHKEIVLAGTNMGLYGLDLKEGYKIDLSELLFKLSNLKDYEFRIRLSSLEPVAINEDILYIMKEQDRICKHLYLPLQSGSDKILNLMERNYTIEDYELVVKKARKLMPDVSIITDVIVGFPGELESDHKKSMEMIKSMEIDKLHVFPYSSRPKTRAKNFPGQVRPDIKDQRVSEMKELGKSLCLNFHRKQVGKTLEVLVERYYRPENKNGSFGEYNSDIVERFVEGEGFSNNYAHVEVGLPEKFIPTSVKEVEDYRLGVINEFFKVKATHATPDKIIGELVFD